MKIGNMVVAASAALLSFATAGDTLSVGDANGYRALVNASGDVVTPSCAWNYDGYPGDVAAPVFWLDANDRTGWEYDPSDSTLVTKVASRVGSRYLTVSPAGVRVPNYNYDAKAPTLVTGISGLKGGAALDFGAYGSERGLFFDEENGTNKLSGVGTIITVYDSSESGGWLLGGASWTRGYGRNRFADNNASDSMWWENTFFYSGAYSEMYKAFVRVNGFTACAATMGMTGGWAVLAVLPTTGLASYSSGLGLGSSSATSGGQRIAEMLIYNTMLSIDDCEKVEAYLRAKWFLNDEPNGVNGRGYVNRLRAFVNVVSTESGAARFEAATPAGETLEIANLKGGRGQSAAGAPRAPAMVKTGAGTLELGNAETYGGAVELHGGTLRFKNLALPTTIPDKCDFRFDASAQGALTTVEEADGKYVTFWRNESSPASTYKGVPVVGARPKSDVARPLLVEDALGPGKHALDFGPFTNVVADGRSLLIVTNKTADIANMTFLDTKAVATYIAVVSVERGGGNIVDVQNARRGNARGDLYTSSIAPPDKIKSDTTEIASRPQVYVNGAKWDCGTGFETPAFQVVSVQCCGNISTFSTIGQVYNHTAAGGFRLAEILVYKRILTEREIKDAHAYLMSKWLGRTAPGYERTGTAAQLPAVQEVCVEEPSEIRVDRGSLRVKTLSLRANLVKSGAGDLCVENLTNFYGTITVKGGSVRRVEPYDPATCCELAPGPSMHLDASDAATIITRPQNGTNFVSHITSRDGRNAALQTSVGDQPWMLPDLTLNGRQIVDFGTYGETKATGARHMKLAHAMDAIRSVFLVWGTQNGGGHVLGNHTPSQWDNSAPQGVPYDFMAYGAGNPQKMFYTGTGASKGDIFTNGVRVAWGDLRSSGYWLMEVHPKCPLYASALCMDRGSNKNLGGQRLAELVVYERPLSEREKVATRNYLMKKWFNVEPDPEKFPAKPDYPVGPVVSDPIVVDGAFELSSPDDLTCREVVGSGAFEKSGAGMLTLREIDGFTGTVTVAEGALRLTGVPRANEPAFTTSGLKFHLDANLGLATTTNAAGTITVSSWESTIADSGKAVGISNPTLREGFLNGMPVVDMTQAKMSAFWFYNASGVKCAVSNICTVLWVIGSQEGGGWMLGGGGAGYAWHRGKSADGHELGTDPDDPIMFSSAAEVARKGLWRRNGLSVDPLTTGLSGGWDVVSYRCDTDKYPDGGNAHGLAMDSRSPGTNARSGSQKLAELAIYNRKLTDEEVAAAETYLNMKWGLGMVRSNANFVSLVVADGAVLDCGGTNQYFAAVSGAGAVTNGCVKTSRAVFDFEAPATLSADAFEFADDFVLELLNASSDVEDGFYPIVDADVFVGRENARGAAVVAPGLPANKPASPVFRKGVFGVRVGRPGVMLIVH